MSVASRRVSAAAAKEAKMKKVAIGGCVLFLALLGYQAPKVLHQLHGSSTPAATTSALGATAAEAPPATLIDQPPPTAGPGQLVSFGLFKSKDPFVQQIAQDTNPAPASPGSPGYKSPPSTSPIVPGPTGTTTPIPTTTPPTTTAPAATTAPVPTTTPSTTPPTTTPTPSTTTPTTTTAAPTSATISTNGVCQIVLAKGTFPTATPYFQLVSIAPDGLSAQIGIAGGSLESGQATITLSKGKPLTLVNTTDGVRYTLELLASCPVAPAPTSTATTTTTSTTP